MAVFAFVTVCVLPMMIWRDPSPSNELRYVSIVEEALRDGHFFCFYNQGLPYTDKPPLYFWLLMLCRLVCGRSVMWLPVLLGSLLPAFVTVAVMDRWLVLSASLSSRPEGAYLSSRPSAASGEISPLSSRPSAASGEISSLSSRPPSLSSRPERSGVENPEGNAQRSEHKSPNVISPLMRLTCASILLGALLFAAQTFFLRMDLLMTMFIVLALFSFWKMYTGEMPDRVGHDEGSGHNSNADRWLLPLYIFLALFTKGPVGFFAPVLIIIAFLALERQLRRIVEFLGRRTWLVLLVLFGGWILGAYLEGGREYINSLLFHQTLDRAVNAFTHKQPFWWYIPTLLYTILPFTLLLIPAVVSLYFKPRRSNHPDGQPDVIPVEPANGQSGVRTCEQSYGHNSGSFVRLLLTSIAVIYVMLSAFSGKLAIYLTPLLPLMAYLMPRFAKITDGRAERLKKIALLIPAVIITLMGTGLWILFFFKGVAPFSKLAFALALDVPYIFSNTILTTAAVLATAFAITIIIIARSGWQKGAIAVTVALYLAVFAFGCTVNHINEWLGYRCVAETALEQGGEECTYNTLFVSRPENMDVYLGCDVVDYKDNVGAFISGIPVAGKSCNYPEGADNIHSGDHSEGAATFHFGDHRGEVLIVPTARLRTCPTLREYLESLEGTPVGPFTVFAL